SRKWSVASCSQDTYIRVWQFSFENEIKEEEMRMASEKLQASSLIEVTELKLKRSSFTFKKNEIIQIVEVTLDSVFLGHEDAVYGLCWFPQQGKNDEGNLFNMLLSSSMDKSMILWMYDEEQKIYVDKARVGEVGGNTLGFYGCTFSPCGTYILGHGYEGALHLWKIEKVNHLS
ncbi:unnamed protein product, partial [Didymodactylos carnosus]